MSDRELIMEIFKRLDNNFFNLNNPMIAETDLEISADSLTDTLYNIGLEDLYEREDGVDDNGNWIARFKIIPDKKRFKEEINMSCEYCKYCRFPRSANDNNGNCKCKIIKNKTINVYVSGGEIPEWYPLNQKKNKMKMKNFIEKIQKIGMDLYKEYNSLDNEIKYTCPLTNIIDSLYAFSYMDIKDTVEEN